MLVSGDLQHDYQIFLCILISVRDLQKLADRSFDALSHSGYWREIIRIQRPI